MRQALRRKTRIMQKNGTLRRLVFALGGLVALGGAGPVTRTLAIPGRDGVPAHDVRLMLWSPPEAAGPILIYEPSWGGRADENTHLAETLVRAGFTVVAVDYATEQPTQFKPALQRMQAPLDLSSDEAAAHTIAEGDWRAVLFASDASVMLDLLPEAKRAPSAGILGWSFGGAVAVEACRQDFRFKACLNMDGWMFGPAADTPSPQPFLVLSGDPLPDKPQTAHDPAGVLDARDVARLHARFAAVGGTYAQLPGLQHDGFSDAGGNPAVHTLVTNFFAHALLGRPAATPPTGVVMHRFPGPAA